MHQPATRHSIDHRALAELIKAWGAQLGFARIRVSDVDLAEAERHLGDWLARGFHGEMAYMWKHGRKRTRPAALVDGTLRVITARMDYLPQRMDAAQAALNDSRIGYISRYALGRDYHKVMRRKLQQLATRISGEVGDFGYRAFCDSAPVMEKALAQKSSIPTHLRKHVGNRIFGCDDCQLVCPWNRYAQVTAQPDFVIRHGLDARALTALFAWDERDFERYTEGSAIRRIGHVRWLRNIAVALGNARNQNPRNEDDARGDGAIVDALRSRQTHPSELVREHVDWALAQHAGPGDGNSGG